VAAAASMGFGFTLTNAAGEQPSMTLPVKDGSLVHDVEDTPVTLPVESGSPVHAVGDGEA